MDLNTPIAAPPPGVIPNYVNPQSRGYETIITVTICLAFMVLFFFMRIYSRVFITFSLGWDDYTCVIGVIGAIVFAGVFTNMLHYHYQVHIWNVTYGEVEGSLKYLLIYTLLYGPTMFFIKVSILFLYLRIFSVDRWMKILIYLGMGYVLLANAIITILFGALCAPRDGQPYIARYHSPQCVHNVNNLSLAASIVNLVGDLYLLGLPLPLVWNMQLSRKKKTGVVAIFMTGMLACMASMTSIIIRALWAHDSDYTYWSPRLVFTGIIEMNIGIICACMPACAALFRQRSRSTKDPSSKRIIVKEQRTPLNSPQRCGLRPERETNIELEEGVVHPHRELDSQTH